MCKTTVSTFYALIILLILPFSFGFLPQYQTSWHHSSVRQADASTARNRHEASLKLAYRRKDGSGQLEKFQATKSAALPWLEAPDYLGEIDLTGPNRGFDPLGLARGRDLSWLQLAEKKHGRLAMLATWGYPVAFLIAPWVSANEQPLADLGERLPGLTLDQIGLLALSFWSLFFLGAAALELRGRDHVWDPLGLRRGKTEDELKEAELKEIKNGRLAMSALLVIYSRIFQAKGGFVLGHQMWGQTCIYNIKASAAAPLSTVCYSQVGDVVPFPMNAEVIYRVLTSYDLQVFQL